MPILGLEPLMDVVLRKLAGLSWQGVLGIFFLVVLVGGILLTFVLGATLWVLGLRALSRGRFREEMEALRGLRFTIFLVMVITVVIFAIGVGLDWLR